MFLFDFPANSSNSTNTAPHKAQHKVKSKNAYPQDTKSVFKTEHSGLLTTFLRVPHFNSRLFSEVGA